MLSYDIVAKKVPYFFMSDWGLILFFKRLEDTEIIVYMRNEF